MADEQNATPAAERPILFWREGYDGGKSGAYVRAGSLNKVIAQWIAEGIPVAGIRIDPENEQNIDVLIGFDESPKEPS